MPTPREKWSSLVQEDFDALLNATVPFAQQLLESRGEFFPYAASVNLEGELTMIAGSAEGEHPLSQDILDVLLEGLIEQRDSIRACCLVSDVGRPTSDAVRVQLEHREDAAITILMEYEIKADDSIDYEELVANELETRIWSDV